MKWTLVFTQIVHGINAILVHQFSHNAIPNDVFTHVEHFHNISLGEHTSALIYLKCNDKCESLMSIKLFLNVFHC